MREQKSEWHPSFTLFTFHHHTQEEQQARCLVGGRNENFLGIMIPFFFSNYWEHWFTFATTLEHRNLLLLQILSILIYFCYKSWTYGFTFATNFEHIDLIMLHISCILIYFCYKSWTYWFTFATILECNNEKSMFHVYGEVKLENPSSKINKIKYFIWYIYRN